jgi:MFS transporter, NNP family, nitrate/nitrite transporter
VEKGEPESSVFGVSNIGPVLFATLIFFLTFVARVLISPLMPENEELLGISHVQSGSLFLFMSMGYFVALIGSWYISSRTF